MFLESLKTNIVFRKLMVPLTGVRQNKVFNIAVVSEGSLEHVQRFLSLISGKGNKFVVQILSTVIYLLMKEVCRFLLTTFFLHFKMQFQNSLICASHCDFKSQEIITLMKIQLKRKQDEKSSHLASKYQLRDFIP